MHAEMKTDARRTRSSTRRHEARPAGNREPFRFCPCLQTTSRDAPREAGRLHLQGVRQAPDPEERRPTADYSPSRKLLSFSDRDGWRSLRSAFASIWRMRSRVTSNCLPTSSSVWSVFISMPKRMRSTFASRGVSVSRMSLQTSRRLELTAASDGAMVDWSSMKSPR